MIKKILFGYSLILAVFISVSGFLGAKKPETLIFQLIFLPVVLYFLLKGVRILRKKEGLSGNIGTGVIVLSITVLAIISGIGLKKVLTNKETGSSVPTPIASPTASPSPTPALKKVIIVIEDGSPAVNIREKATIYSPILKKVKDGSVFEVLEEEKEWFKIKLDEEAAGYVSKRYAKLAQDE